MGAFMTTSLSKESLRTALTGLFVIIRDDDDDDIDVADADNANGVDLVKVMMSDGNFGAGASFWFFVVFVVVLAGV